MKKNVLFLVFLSVFMLTKAQRFYLPEDVKHSTIRFNLVNNLIVVPVEVNGTSLSFILDTGVSRPILFNISEQDSVALSNLNPIKIQGLGSNGPVQAFRSTANKMRIGKAQNIYQDLFLVMDKDINLSPSLGVAVHGMIGFDLFRDFVVEINYSAKKLKLINRRHYRKKLCNSCEELPIEIYRNKAYVIASTSNLDKSNNVKLLIDTGSSDAIWLFADEALQLQVPQKSFEDFLGRGLSGNIFGFRGKYDYLHFGEFSLKEPVVSFPDRQYFLPMKNKIGRNGSVGGAVLRRFKIVFDYQSKHIILKKNTMFKKPFAYNVSGIELRHQGMRYVKELVSAFGLESGTAARYADSYGHDKVGNGVTVNLSAVYKYKLHPAFEIAQIREQSPAYIAGLRQGDTVISVDGKPTHRYNLQEIMGLINKKEGRKVTLMVERSGQKLKFRFFLNKSL